MAVVRARSSPPYALIGTVVVAVAATALAVFFYLNWNKASIDAQEANSRLDKIASRSDQTQIVPNFAPAAGERASAIAVAQRQVNDLKDLLVGDPKLSVDAIKAEVGTNRPLVSAFKQLKADRDQKATALAELENQSKAMRAEVESQNKQSNDARLAAESTVEELRAQLVKASADIAAANQARDAANQKAQEDLAKKDAANEQQRREIVLQLEQANNELANQQKLVAQYKQKVEGSIKGADVNVGEPDGRVLRVNASAGEVYINLTSRDNRVMPGLTFTCFDPRTGVRFGTDEAALGDGSIEVIQVGENSTLCRITRVTKDRTIQAGDLIANIVYHNDKGRTFRFVVYGDFDLDGDGVATAAERERLVGLIRNWGGQVDNAVSTQTDYLVMGAKPSGPTVIQESGTTTAPGSTLDERQKAQDQYDALVEDARRLGIPVLNANRFLALIGYYNTTVTRY